MILMGTSKKKGIREVEKISRKREDEICYISWSLSKKYGWCGVYRVDRRTSGRRDQNKSINWINEFGESPRSAGLANQGIWWSIKSIEWYQWTWRNEGIKIES